MKYYIPFSLKDGDHAIYDVITSIISAEGFAPTDATAFTGVEPSRSSPTKFTGYHPLNPFRNRVLVYDKMPLLSQSGKYAVDSENTVYLYVECDAIEMSDEGKLKLDAKHPLKDVGLYTTNQALFFKDPSKVSFLFMSERMFEKCEGCKTSGINSKNETLFGYRLVTEADLKAGVVVSDSQVDKISDVSLYNETECKSSYALTWEKESLHGAVLGYKIIEMQGSGRPTSVVQQDWRRFLQLKSEMHQFCWLSINWAGQDKWNKAVETLEALPQFVVEQPKYFRKEDFDGWEEQYKALLRHFIQLAVSLKQKNWNWADAECRASFAETVLDRCICPMTKEYYANEEGENSIETASKLISVVARYFREYNNINLEFNENDLNSPFIRALYRFLQSEGRQDRISEYLAPGSNLDLKTRKILAAMFGAFKGYAQMSVKRLTSGLDYQKPTQAPLSVAPRSQMPDHYMRVFQTMVEDGLISKTNLKRRHKLEEDIALAAEHSKGNVAQFIDGLRKIDKKRWTEKCLKQFAEKVGYSENLLK